MVSRNYESRSALSVGKADDARKRRSYEEADSLYKEAVQYLKEDLETYSTNERVDILKKVGSLYNKLSESAYEHAIDLVSQELPTSPHSPPSTDSHVMSNTPPSSP